ncbi:potassium transporter Kup [Phyllobacterium myrsinacearum]|uniref:Probable potassium transport system protein Kup n=1 Tax=Phyllobacterium myrsinacearum TaxID=28101 RepID=A0A2S9JXE8_9HYPH|nr:potassium transporter Kup [Phyllobacterium myrsinacearum]PRD58007.1 potassium transporter Kup [Phyllobacterium myrsinacearum]PWV96192.1 KUP system potassium uptake protein [Phyllobacterium myrsinacearum]RZS83475.1 KUP system potassium uptake protein [Phyllobacterium myrsinacearum]RZV09818.1 KUP system potassium uptake protein [Phyllobacterium myrsinacearum]
MSDQQVGDENCLNGTAAYEPEPHHKEAFPVLVLGALGVVYGDIGTSPIYAFREALHAASLDGVLSRTDILGVVSMIFWALTLIVTIKYVFFVLRADNDGEGGILSLMALARSSFKSRPQLILGLGIVGASLFYGDAVITPAISVLSAVEGLEIVTPSLEPFVVPITLVILLTLFSVQRFGTARVATIFGPITLLWFLAIGFFGAWHLFDDVSIFAAANPYYAVDYILENPATAFPTIGTVFLAVTGAEALYADLGHFGRKPIATAWVWVVFPCLLLNYFGQGAFILAHGESAKNPFFEMFPHWALLPMVLLATAATVIASQAVISGAYSLSRQAVQLNLLPRLNIEHTSEKQSGQVYLPRVNMLLGLVVILLVLGFERSTNLASAYGIAVTGNMLVTTILLFIVMSRIWKWRLWVAVSLTVSFIIVDLTFVSANLIKVVDGGWASLVVAFLIILVMFTWVRGSRQLFEKTRKGEVPLDLISKKMAQNPPPLVPGTAVFLTGDPKSTPTALMHSLKHYKVLHQNNVILTVITAPSPLVKKSERVKIEPINDLFMRVTLTFGYMERPNIPRTLAICRKQGWKFDIMTTSFFLSRRSLKASARSEMPHWQDRLFIALARTASDATEYFQIPTGRVVEIGTQVNI